MKLNFWQPSKLLLLLGIIFTLSSCDNEAIKGDGNVVQDRRALQEFSKLDIKGEYTIVLKQSATPELLVTTDQNLLAMIKTEVNGSTLNISSDEELDGSDGITLIISYPDLESLEIGGAVKLSNEGVLKAKEFTMDIAGAGWVDLNMEVEEVALDLSGAASVTLNGSCGTLEIDMSGAGTLDAYGLQASDCDVSLSGIGNANIYVTQNLEAKVSGVGSVRYRGNPRNLRRDVSGVGSIEPASDDEQDEQI
jgi:hypothetical protein